MAVSFYSNALLEACVFGMSKNWRFDFCLSVPPSPDGGDLPPSRLAGGPYHTRLAAFRDLSDQVDDHLRRVNRPVRPVRGDRTREPLSRLARHWLVQDVRARTYKYEVRLDASTVVRGEDPVERLVVDDFLSNLCDFLRRAQVEPPFPSPAPWWAGGVSTTSGDV